MPAKKARPRKRRTPASPVHINALGLDRRFSLEVDASLQAEALRWNYVLRNRTRWTSRGDTSHRQREEIVDLLRDLGLRPTDFTAFAEAEVVEVSMPYEDEEVGWEYRIFPWEYALASATRDHRRPPDRDFTVVRHLRRKRTRDRRQSDTLMYIQSAPPGPLSDDYDFASERQLMDDAARSMGLALDVHVNPTLADLSAAVRTVRPKIIHLAGFDTHQAAELLGLGPTQGGRQRLDGVLLSDGRTGYGEVSSMALARALTGDGTAPELVSCNIYYSGPRTAALCVGLGAQAAIGFQDTVDDALAELFYATLYRAWTFGEQSATAAFRYAWHQVRAQGRPTTGSGLVLWNARSLRPTRYATPTLLDVKVIEDKWMEHRERQVTAATARDDIEVRVAAVDLLNYSILHNNRPLFETFTLKKKKDDIGAVVGIDVDVELQVGSDSYPFRCQASIPATQDQVDIANDIAVSLTSALSRAARESIRTSLFVDVSFAGVPLLRKTRRVTLLPVDEWQDSDENRKWLPSFVLPRDPAVSRVIDLSQRYLQALRDDPTAGFDGYQCVNVTNAKRGEYDCEGVDRQVQAIWSALLYETPLSYINPPPVFTDRSQRLRSPSDVIDGHRGTCIDLALLIAACLEYVDIHPAVILLTDHAFPCYWRAEEYYDDFFLARSETIEAIPTRDPSRGSAAPHQTDSWYFVKAHFREVLGEINAGRLVPLEATCLCWRNSFADALDQGFANLSRRSRFDSMLDIRAARTDSGSPVTPLPILRVEA